MPAAASSPSAARAGRYLHDLLRDRYQLAWRPFAQRLREGELNLRAIATVLARHLWDYPEHPGDDDVEPDQLIDTVWRAVHGRSLSLERLELFIAAFGMDEQAEALRELWHDALPRRVVVGELGDRDAGSDVPKPYRTVQLHEFHYLGADGRAKRHRTVQAIRALQDGLACHRYTFDASQVSVERIHGGIPGKPWKLTETLTAVDIRLPQVLGRGDTASLEYLTRFHPGLDLEPNFRRASHRPVDDLVIRIEFHPEALPEQVYWAEWDDYRGEEQAIVHQEPVSLDPEHSAHRHLEYLCDGVVGFGWMT